MNRIVFQCTPAVHKRLLALEHRTGAADIADLIRKAMALIEVAVKVRQSGGRLLAESADGSITEIDLSLIPRETP